MKKTDNNSAIDISVVIPFYNEDKNVERLYHEIVAVFSDMDKTFELVFVNDGSEDDTLKVCTELADQDDRVQVIDLVRNYGQTAALMAGIEHSCGATIVSMDGDGQNDPSSIPDLLEKMDEGYSVVSGWRVDRQDKALSRKLPSKVANWLISVVSGVHIHDYGCALKAYRREFIASIRLYGEMHRFVPIYAIWQGGKIAEVPVKHRAREYGTSNYGLNRIFKVLLDLLLVMFMERFMTKPIYFFGGFGLFALLLSFLHALWAIWLKVFDGISFIQTPLPTLIGSFFSTGIICILMGLLAEILIRTYFEAQDKKAYKVQAKTKCQQRDQ